MDDPLLRVPAILKQTEIADRFTHVCPVCGEGVRAVAILPAQDEDAPQAVELVCVNDHRVEV